MAVHIKLNRLKLFRQGVIACVPTLLSYWAVGFACGAIGKVSGFSITEVTLLSMFLYAGSAQFLFYSLASTGADIAQITLAVAFINMRYLLINTYMSQFFNCFSPSEKLISGLMITDETFGVSSGYAKQHEGSLPFYWLLGLNPNWLRDGLGFSLIGMFAGLLLLSWFVSRTRILDIIVMAVAMLVIVFTHHAISFNIATIGATLIAATAGMFLLIWQRDI